MRIYRDIAARRQRMIELNKSRSLPVEIRLWNKVIEDGECLIWTGCTSKGGYGSMQIKGRKRLVHRVSYELHIGKIQMYLEIDHLCRNRLCVNPNHLEPVTCAENVQRAKLPIYRKTHCKYGHEFTEANTYWYGNARKCRHCHADRGWKQIYKRRKYKEQFNDNSTSSI